MKSEGHAVETSVVCEGVVVFHLNKGGVDGVLEVGGEDVRFSQ